MEECMCGHEHEAHGHDPEYPGSTACSVEDCDCLAYEPNPESEEADENDQ